MNISFSIKPIKVPSFTQQTQIKTDWNAIIKHHAKHKNDDAILSTYMQMQSLHISPDTATLPLVFKACTRLNAFERGKKLHYSVEGTDLMNDVKVGTAIIDFYCKCGHVNEASEVFWKLRERDLVTWNAMLSGCVGCGCFEEAIWLFKSMQKGGFEPNSRTLVALLMASEGLLELRLGQEIHSYCIRNGFLNLHPHVGTALLGFYLNFDPRISSLVFDTMAVRSAVSWNAMITGYFDAGNFIEALDLFVRMVVKDGIEFDKVTILVVIQAIAEFGSLELGMQVHQLVIKSRYDDDLFIQNALLNMYVDVGSLELACQLFDSVFIRDVALWNSMIAAYISYACCDEAINLLSRMRMEIRENERTIVTMLSSCAELADGLKMGRSLHAISCKSSFRMDISIGNALLGMYAALNCAEDALKVFNGMSNVDVFSYNTLISALSSSNLRDEAWELFGMMRESEVGANSHTMISLLAACGDETCLNIGRCIHGFIIKHSIEVDISLNTSLTDMYMNCGDEVGARHLFEVYPKRDLISWNAMIGVLLKNNKTNEALLFFNRMISEVEPNSITIINVLSVCTDIAGLLYGQCLHAYAERRYSPFSANLSLANAFVTMYARCGTMEYAEKIFKTLQKRNTVSWNAMITGYATNGSAYDAIFGFEQMLEDGFQPNGVTFLSVMSACRHTGLIEKGLHLFDSMVHDFKLTPVLAHYGCMVDLLGRGGCLDEAKEFIDAMPIEADASVWRALLSACRDHSNPELAPEIFKHLVELEPDNAGNYILLSNIYAAAGLWSEVRKIRRWLKERGLKKPPGSSWIVIRGQTHSFTAGDTTHPQSKEVYENLNSLLEIMRGSGYVTEFRTTMDNEEDYTDSKALIHNSGSSMKLHCT